MSWMRSGKLSNEERDAVMRRLQSELDRTLALAEGETITRLVYCEFAEFPNMPDKPPGVLADKSDFGLLVLTDRRLVYLGIAGLKGVPESLGALDTPAVDRIEMKRYDEITYESIIGVEFADYMFGTLILTVVGRHGDHSHRHQFSNFKELGKEDFRTLPVPGEERLGRQLEQLVRARVRATRETTDGSKDA